MTTPQTVGIQTAGIMPDGRPVRQVTITSPNGAMRATILEYGARLISLTVPDASGRPTEVTLGRNDLPSWLNDDVCMGAIMGRNTSRIAGARCVIDGTAYQLADNDNGNNAHSGPHGFEQALWQIDCETACDNAVTLRLTSPHMSQGFPGTMTVTVTYTLTSDTLTDGALTISFAAVSDRTTICNPTSHIYWNLDGNLSRRTDGKLPEAPDALDHTLRLATDRYFPTDEGFLPFDAEPVDGTPFDLRTPRRLRDMMNTFPGDHQLEIGRGYNHAYDFAAAYARLSERQNVQMPVSDVQMPIPDVQTPDSEPLIPMATLSGERSGITMNLACDAPALVVYSAGWFDRLAGRNGQVYGPGAGIALEPGFVPNAINDDHHGTTPRPLLAAGQPFAMTIRYTFHA